MTVEKYQLSTGALLETYRMDPQVSFRVWRERPAIIICPGGAYMIHAVKEGEPVAHAFLARGYQCFVLKYSVMTDREAAAPRVREDVHYPQPVLELMEALHLVRQHAAEWHIDPSRVFVMGFSAGGHVCASLGVRWQDPALTGRLPFRAQGRELRPTGMVLGYPMLRANAEAFRQAHPLGAQPDTEALMNRYLYDTEVPTPEMVDGICLERRITADCCPAFLWHSIDDPVVDPGNSTSFVAALCRAGVACEYHLFDHGGHGRSLANELVCRENEATDPHLASWVELADYWMKGCSCDDA